LELFEETSMSKIAEMHNKAEAYKKKMEAELEEKKAILAENTPKMGDLTPDNKKKPSPEEAYGVARRWRIGSFVLGFLLILSGIVYPYLFLHDMMQGITWWLVGLLIIGLGLTEWKREKQLKAMISDREKSSSCDEKTQVSKGENA